MIFHSRKLSPAELNHNIYNKKLLAIINTFKQRRVYYKELVHPIQVFSDHKNLTTFITIKVLNRKQIQWAKKLSSYNFIILYYKGSENGRVNTLSQKANYFNKKK